MNKNLLPITLYLLAIIFVHFTAMPTLAQNSSQLFSENLTITHPVPEQSQTNVTSHNQSDDLFKPGYFITNSGDTTQALIQDAAWRDNPVSFIYKKSAEDEHMEASIANVSEFGIPELFKYIRATVSVDVSQNSGTNQISNSRNPDFEKQTVFLKVLVDGTADLYFYQNGNRKLFFYQTIDRTIQPLLYKKYLNKDGKIAQNNQYLQELWGTLNCINKTKAEMRDVSYSNRDLRNYFADHNQCLQSDLIVYRIKLGGALFDISLIPSVNLTQLESTVRIDDQSNTFTHNRGGTFRLGIAVEYRTSRISKWSFILEPAYRVMNEQYTIRNREFDMDFQAFQIPVMVRRYFKLSNETAFYINPILLGTLPFNSKIVVENLPNIIGGRLESFSNTRLNVGGGVGFRFKRFSVEFRRYLNKDLLLVGDTSFNIGSDRMLSTLTFSIQVF